MSDERISEALRALPRDAASPEFTANVLRRLESRRFLPSYRGLAAAAVVALALGFGWSEWLHHRTQQQAVVRLDALLVEKQALESELDYLRQLTARARPVVYLGATEELDLVLDLAHLHSRGLTDTSLATAAALHHARFSYADGASTQRVTY